jgi:hypothetical protein
MPGARDFEPGNEVEVEVVPAGGSAPKQQPGGGERGTQQSREREPLRSVEYHGVSRSVCSVAALTAEGVKGSAKVVALYQAGHWSR